MRTNFLQLERSFFSHAKTEFLIESHGIPGAYCLLYIWSEMMHRDGAFDPSSDLDILGAAKRAMITMDEVRAIINTCIKINLLTREKKSGFLIKDRIDNALDALEDLSAKRSKAGKEGVIAKREKKQKLANELLLLKQNESNSLSGDEANTKLLTNELTNKVSNGTTEGSSSITGVPSNGSTNSDRLTDLWVRLSSKVNLNAEQAKELGDAAKKEIALIEGSPHRKKIWALIGDALEKIPADFTPDSIVGSLEYYREDGEGKLEPGYEEPEQPKPETT